MAGKTIRRAWHDTKSVVGGYRALVGVVVLPLMGCGLHYLIDGHQAMAAEAYIWALYGLGPLIGLCLILLIYNLVAAPYRNARDERDALQEQIGPKGSVAQVFEKREVLTLQEASSLLGPTDADRKLLMSDFVRAIREKRLSVEAPDAMRRLRLRSSMAFHDDDTLKNDAPNLLVRRAALRGFLEKSGYHVPDWLKA